MNRLKAYRLRMGLTQQDVASRVGISTRSYQFYESGQRLPDVQTAICIARVFNVPDVKELWNEHSKAV